MSSDKPEPADLQPSQLLQMIAEFLEDEQVPYRVVGSMASIAYGEFRFTNDIDIVADLNLANVDALCHTFAAPDFYVARHAVEEAIRNRFQFNIIHIFSGLKIDVILPKESDYARLEQSRAQRLSSPDGFAAWFATPEDVILNKLIFFQLGGIEKHLRDIAGIIRVKGDALDLSYIDAWSGQLNVASEWELVKQRLRENES